MSEHPEAICLMGPTATGKTALALALHEVLPVDIISVDSSQVYRGMDIGTAKPTAEEQAQAPHRLIDIRDPAEPYSAAQFCVDAAREMDAIRTRGRVPLLVGGTMFYFHALEFGLSSLPSADPDLRARIAAEAERHGWPVLHRRLAAIDPIAAARIHAHDAQRIQRALEIAELGGRAPTAVTGSTPRRPRYDLIRLALLPDDRAALRERIAHRFQSMLRRGLIEEVERLRNRDDLHPGLPSMRTVGYRQVWDYLTGNLNYNEMVERSVIATRQLAKRQLTWLRHYPGVHGIGMDSNEPVARCLRMLKQAGHRLA